MDEADEAEGEDGVVWAGINGWLMPRQSRMKFRRSHAYDAHKHVLMC